VPIVFCTGLPLPIIFFLAQIADLFRPSAGVADISRRDKDDATPI
jgi:hypothetical protein